MKDGILNPAQLLEYFQGHRRVTRKTIEKFPEKDLFEFSIGGMRPFSQMIEELLAIAGPGLKQIVEKTQEPHAESLGLSTKEEILKCWDEQTEIINTYFKQIPAEKFPEKFNLYGQYNLPIIHSIFYFINNEIHHRAQGFTYLRALGIEPPFFWEM
ncbi:DinB family protein [Apibacter sp. HY039]|uniref:DinB family protein n=1 Tax=Apibacter sp. HY039 TaxID=2501476 RepID=UPI0016257F69|nr:DinB family protein [Apibacter sp. HY039]